ncbi:MAG: hypothetical protein IPK19_36450 [Chloroflexi bacterium]|nr:hypothetical protein [Chloroflexota bacterium]
MRYGLSVHGLIFRNRAMRVAAELNHPLIAVQGRRKATNAAAPPITRLIGPSSHATGAIIQTVKRSEDGQAIIFRLYESTGAPRKIDILFGFPVEAAHKTDLHEKVTEEIKLRADGQTIDLPLRPFEIVTLRVVPKK